MGANYSIAATRGYVRVGATRLSYLDWGGEGQPALLLHGITSDAAALWRVAPALIAAGLRPVALDMPGHGESDVSQAHDIDTVAGLAGGAIEALGLREVTLVGHSWGGATALALAGGEHPARRALARVALVDPALGIDPEWGAARLPDYTEGVGEPFAVGLPAIRAKNPAWLDEDVHWKALAMERCRREQVAGFFLPPAAWDLIDRLSRVAVPLLILVAEPAHTVIPPERLAEARRALVPGLGRLVQVPGTNHNMFRGPGYEPTMAALLAWIAASREAQSD
jgi:pimeloyl-ACP methyl ester carboxylesterase